MLVLDVYILFLIRQSAASRHADDPLPQFNFFYAGIQFTANVPVSPRYAATSKLQMTSCSNGLMKKPPLRELGCWELLSQKLSLSTLTCRMSIRTISSNSMTHFLEQVCRFYVLLHTCSLLHIGPAAVYLILL